MTAPDMGKVAHEEVQFDEKGTVEVKESLLSPRAQAMMDNMFN